MVRRLCCCLWLWLFAAQVAWAEVWNLEHNLAVASDYSDNRFLNPVTPEQMFYTSLAVGVKASRESRLDMLSFYPSARFSRYSRRSEYDNEVYSAELGYSRSAERLRWNLQSSTSRDSTLSTAYDESGIVNKDISRSRWNVGPSLEWEASPRLGLSIGINHSRLSYDNTVGTTLVDYQHNSLQAAALYKFSMQNQLRFSLTATDLDVELPGYRNRDYSLNLGLSSQLTPRLRSELALGGHKTEIDVLRSGVSLSDTKDGWLALAKSDYSLESGHSSFSMSRSVEPSTYGALMQKDQVSISLRRDLSVRISAISTVALFRTTSLAEIDSDSRDFSRFDVGLRWRYSRELIFLTSYSRLYSKLHDAPENSDANLISVSLSYSGSNKLK